MKSKHFLYYFMAFAMLVSCATSCSDDKEEPHTPSSTDGYVGEFSGRMTLNIAGQYDYDADIRISVSEGANETLSITFPEYEVFNTLMGDITLGSLTLENLVYDSVKGGYCLDYGDAGISQYFKAERNGTVTMNGEYPLNPPSDILVTKDKDGEITVVNSFRLGAMPMPITATFRGRMK